MDEQSKARMRLYLRSERAMGLNAVPGAAGHANPEGSAPEAEEPAVAQPQAAADPRREPPQPKLPAKSLAQAVPPKTRYGAGNEVAAAKSEGLMPLPTDAPFTAPVLSADQKRRRLIAMDENEVRGCTKCRLCETRTHTVFGEGDADAQIFFIGEGPGETEDQTGRPFVGRAGELLNKMIAGMGLKREQVMIANIVKCRPPGNRVPAPDEVATCTPYLVRQLEIVRPGVIVTLGLPATQYMLQTKLSMGKLRGSWQSWRGIKLMPTYHPAYVLRNPTYQARAAVWSDLKQVLAELGLPVPLKNL
ncbi:MAG TPA: uracil-DNA glycosylase [Tepidisphaeraceae bacterium]|jgi:DNA polymerase